MENLNENINRIKQMMGLNESKVSLPIKVEGSYQGSSGDKLHAFQSTGGVVVGGMQTKVNAKLKELYNLGVNPDITDIKVSINATKTDKNGNITAGVTSWSVTIDESKDGKAYLGLVTVGSCCNSSYSTRAVNQVETMKKWNSKPNNHYLVADIQTTTDGKTNGNITIEGGNYKLRQIFYKYTYDNKPPHKVVKEEKPKTKQNVKYEIDPRLKSQPADATRVQLTYPKIR